MMVDRERLSEVLSSAVCLHDQAAVEAALDRMAEAMTARLADAHPILICVVNGAIVPMGHLMTRLSFPLEVNYAHATRYSGGQRGGELQWIAKPTCELKDRVVVIVDDILDGGVTLTGIVDYCKVQGAQEVLTAVLVDKEVPRQAGALAHADFTGLTVGNHYVFGYGMDFEENMRHLPAIYRIDESHATS